MINLCDYGCGQEAKYQFKNGRWCCSDHYSSCKAMKEKNREANLDKTYKDESIERMRKSALKRFSKKKEREKQSKIMTFVYKDPEKRKAISKRQKERYNKKSEIEKAREIALNRNNISYKRTIEKLSYKYPFFSQIEEIRYNPDKAEEKEIQVHCKNHNCPNSKEQGGWFTPTSRQIESRIWAIENENGNGGCYFYCSDECKNICPLFYLRSDPFEFSEKIYTDYEYQVFRKFVLERDNHECQYCGEKAEHVHHERPQKLEPFFTLDPDYAWSCCEKCHYKYGHKDECSTGNLSKKICGGSLL